MNPADALTTVQQPMSAEQTATIITWLMSGQAAVEDGAAALRAWAERGETGIELASVVRLLRAKSVGVPITSPVCDVCGTGGSGLQRYNVSTTTAFILAAAKVPVAKHGNKGSRRPMAASTSSKLWAYR